MSDTHFTLGEHEAKIDTLVKGQEQIFTIVNEIRTVLAERAGERRGLRIVSAVVAGLVGLVASVVAILSSKLWYHPGP